jgi:ribosomal protein L35
LPHLYSPLNQLKHQQLLPLQQVLQHQLRQKLRRTKRSLQKANLLRKSQLKQTQKPLLQQSNFGLDDSDFIVDDEVTFGRNLKARDFGKLIEDDLSDYVKFRLWLARQLAMKKFDQVHG